MKRVFILLVVSIICFSCGSDHTDYSGDWIDERNEKDRIIISKNGDNYIVEADNRKFPGQIKDGLLEISTEMPLKATIDENDNLIINGNEYIRFEKSFLFNILTNWKGDYMTSYGSENKRSIERVNISFTQNENGEIEQVGFNTIGDNFIVNRIVVENKSLKIQIDSRGNKVYMYATYLPTENKLKITSEDNELFFKK